jgi:phosphatidylglycerol:prolipoprotein diacylglycerol transferase
MLRASRPELQRAFAVTIRPNRGVERKGMHPTLIDQGWFQIRSYGFMLAVSFLVGIYFSAWRAKRHGIKPQVILDLSVYIILAAVVGSRLLYVLFHLDDFSNPLQFFSLWEGGATFYGGLALAIVVSVVFAGRKKISFLQLADIMSPSIALGMALTRVGCFLSGCCYGKPTDAPWGVVFPPSCPAGHSANEMAFSLGVDVVHLHPTQLYSVLYGLSIFAVLLLVEKKLARRGALFGLLLVLAGTARFTVDFFRFFEDNSRALLGLSVSQVVAIGLVLLGVYLLSRRSPAKDRNVTD